MAEDWRPPDGAECYLEAASGEPVTCSGTTVSGNGVRIELADAAPPGLLDRPVVVTCGTPDALHVMNGFLRPVDSGVRFVELDAVDVMHLQRRSEPRIEIELPVTLADVEGPTPLVSVTGHTLNVSSGGCRVLCERPLPSGVDPLVTVRLADGKPPVTAEAAVLERDQVDDGWDYRLVFTDIRVDDRLRLTRLGAG